MAPTKGTVEISRNNARRIIEALPDMLSSGSVVFDIETTGINRKWEEIVSIAVKSPVDQVEMQTLIMPKRPKRLLQKGKDGKCAYDINGIHPDDLIGSPTFEEAYPQIREALAGKRWVCWNAAFDVGFLDEICARRNVENIPRAGVFCAMKLLSPLAGLRGQRRGKIERVRVVDRADDRARWQQLSRLAGRMGIDARNAHEAAADVAMTIEVIKWASENLTSLPAPRSTAASASRKATPVIYKDKERKGFGQKTSASERQKTSPSERQKTSASEPQKTSPSERQKTSASERQKTSASERQKTSASERQRISASERQKILKEKIVICQATGMRLESSGEFQAVLATPQKTNHVMHLIVSFFTLGLWLPVWLLITLTRKNRREVLQVDEAGIASLKPAKS